MLLLVLNMVSAVKQMQDGNVLGGLMTGANGLYDYTSGLPEDSTSNNNMTDAGVRRNYL